MLGTVAVVGVVALLVVVLHNGLGKSAHDLPFRKTTGPGSVVSARTMPDLPLSLRFRARAARVVYHSTDENGAPTVVSGSVFTPRGKAPADGWPVIGLAHATTGIGYRCAPSLSSTLLGSAGIVTGYVRAGYAVALPDYQGLGSSGVHPYLDSPVAARNLIDSVRALRLVFSPVSSRWLAAGLSQGGGAAWSANEQAKTYAPELDLVGSVSVAPDADMTSMVTEAEAGTMAPGERAVYQWFLASYADSHPQFDLDDYRSPDLVSKWATLSSCGPATAAARTAALTAMGPADLRPSSPDAAARLTAILQKWALPQHPASAPMLVLYGSADPLVAPASTTAAIARARLLGDQVSADLQQGRGHNNVDVAAVPQWIADRFK